MDTGICLSITLIVRFFILEVHCIPQGTRPVIRVHHCVSYVGLESPPIAQMFIMKVVFFLRRSESSDESAGPAEGEGGSKQGNHQSAEFSYKQI